MPSAGSVAGFGNPPSAATGPPGPKKMDGIGNPMFKDPRQQSQQKQPHDLGTMTIGDVFSAAKDGFMGIIKGQSDTGRANAGSYTSGGNVSFYSLLDLEKRYSFILTHSFKIAMDRSIASSRCTRVGHFYTRSVDDGIQ
jgi:hypothetical protein